HRHAVHTCPTRRSSDLVDVMTDKALVQIPAKEDGVITKLYYAKGDIAKVHEPLYAIQTTGAATAASIAPDATDTTVTTTVQNGGNEAVTDFILPDIGEGIVECEIVEWQVKEGDTVEEDQPIVDVMTDKALVQIPAKESGTIEKLYYAQGDIAKVHAPLYAIRVAGSAQTEAAARVTSTPVASVAPTA